MKDIDLSELDLSTIGTWPVAIKAAVVGVMCLLVLGAGYFLHIQSMLENMERVRVQESTLKNEFEKKQAKAANLESYKNQMKEMEASFGTMLRQLPSKTEVDDLLIDISQTGLSSGVEFELFKPQAEKQIDFYAELPIEISMLGDYHEFGRFVSGVAALPRIVTLHNIKLSSGEQDDGRLKMDVTAKTYRYLDEDELAAARKSSNDKRRRR